jgi:hypothetical protein
VGTIPSLYGLVIAYGSELLSASHIFEPHRGRVSETRGKQVFQHKILKFLLS